MSGGSRGSYLTPTLSFAEHSFTRATSSGLCSRSRMVPASTLAPATSPLCPMDVAGAIAAHQWWNGTPGTLLGKWMWACGTIQVMSPLSLEWV